MTKIKLRDDIVIENSRKSDTPNVIIITQGNKIAKITATVLEEMLRQNGTKFDFHINDRILHFLMGEY